MLGSSSSLAGGAAEAVHHPGCSSEGPRRKRHKTSHSLQRFANRFVDPWAFPAIQLDELTIEVVVQTRSKAKIERSSSTATSSETIRPFKNEAQRSKPASSVAKVLPVSPTKLKTACVPPIEEFSQLESKSLCEILQPGENFGRLENKDFYEAIATAEKYVDKNGTLQESSTAFKRKRDQFDEESSSGATCEVASTTASVQPICSLNSNSQLEIIDPDEINGHAFEVRGSSLPSVANVAADLVQISKDNEISKSIQANPILTGLKLVVNESAPVKPSNYQNVAHTTRSLATGVTKSMAMVVPTAKVPTQTVAAVRPQPSSQFVIMQSEHTSSVPQHQSLAQVMPLLDSVAPGKSSVPTIVQAPPSYYVMDQSPPVQFFTPGPTVPHIVLEAAPPVMPTEVLQVCNPINSSGLSVLQATNGLPVLQPLTLMPAPGALQQQQPFNSISQAALPSGFRQAGPHNQLPRTSQSCSTQLSASTPRLGSVSALTHHRAACAGQRPLINLSSDLHPKTNVSSFQNERNTSKLNYQARISLSDAVENAHNRQLINGEILKSGTQKCISYSSSPNVKKTLSPDPPSAVQSTSSPLKCIETSSLEKFSNHLLKVEMYDKSSASYYGLPVSSELSNSSLPEKFSIATTERQFVSQCSHDRDCHLVANSCSRNSPLTDLIQPVEAACHFSAEKYECRAQHKCFHFFAREMKLHQGVARIEFNTPFPSILSSSSFHELDGLVNLSFLKKLFHSKSERNFSKTRIDEFQLNSPLDTTLHAILDDWFTDSCCSAFSHLTSMFQKISVTKLFDWQVSRGFRYGLKVPRLVSALLSEKGRTSYIMTSLCFRKGKNERLNQARNICMEKNIKFNSVFSSDQVPSTEKPLRKSGDLHLVVQEEQVVVQAPDALNKQVSSSQESNTGAHYGDEDVSLLSVRNEQNEYVVQLDWKNKLCKEVTDSALKTQEPPRVEKLSRQPIQTFNITTLTEIPSKSLCTFDTVSLFSNPFGSSFSSIAKSFESGILTINDVLPDRRQSDELPFHKTIATSIIHNGSNSTKKQRCGMDNLHVRATFDRIKGLNSTLGELPSHADQKDGTQKWLPSTTKVEYQAASFKPHNSDSVLSPSSMASSHGSTLRSERSIFCQTNVFSSVKQKSLGIVDISLFHNGGHSRLQSIESEPDKVNENVNIEIEKAFTVSVEASPSYPGSDANSFNTKGEDDVDEKISGLKELPNDDDAYEELLKCGYEVERPSLKFPSRARLGLNGKVSYKVYGKVKTTQIKKKKKKIKYDKKKQPSEVKKKVKKRFKSRIAQQAVNDIINARQPAEMPSHIINSVEWRTLDILHVPSVAETHSWLKRLSLRKAALPDAIVPMSFLSDLLFEQVSTRVGLRTVGQCPAAVLCVQVSGTLAASPTACPIGIAATTVRRQSGTELIPSKSTSLNQPADEETCGATLPHAAESDAVAAAAVATAGGGAETARRLLSGLGESSRSPL
ncbi:hypothetical protein FHG87_012066 [Trinorchestia longiramus]|nr:hypothetical protein FHG87_012066 [Trinorchestia longiramus]